MTEQEQPLVALASPNLPEEHSTQQLSKEEMALLAEQELESQHWEELFQLAEAERIERATLRRQEEQRTARKEERERQEWQNRY